MEASRLSNQPKSADTDSANRLRARNTRIKKIRVFAENGAQSYHIISAGTAMMSPNIRFSPSRSSIRLASIAEGGMGMDSNRSLSFAS